MFATIPNRKVYVRPHQPGLTPGKSWMYRYYPGAATQQTAPGQLVV
ncbi:MAG: hypothetical protein LH609_00525 [Rudanella sp.]|nr:hypothetical protein [Rudanella sp.]